MVKQAWHLESCIWTTSVFEGLLRSLWLVHLFASLSTLQPRKADREKKERGKKKQHLGSHFYLKRNGKRPLFHGPPQRSDGGPFESICVAAPAARRRPATEESSSSHAPVWLSPPGPPHRHPRQNSPLYISQPARCSAAMPTVLGTSQWIEANFNWGME